MMNNAIVIGKTNSIAIGSNAVATGTHSIAIGNNSIATGTHSIAIGRGSGQLLTATSATNATWSSIVPGIHYSFGRNYSSGYYNKIPSLTKRDITRLSAIGITNIPALASHTIYSNTICVIPFCINKLGYAADELAINVCKNTLLSRIPFAPNIGFYNNYLEQKIPSCYTICGKYTRIPLVKSMGMLCQYGTNSRNMKLT